MDKNQKIEEQPSRTANPPPSQPAALSSPLPAILPPQPIPLSAPQPPGTYPTPPIPTVPSSLDLARQLIPKAVRDRKFRADSFLSKLKSDQRILLANWLMEDSVAEVQRRIALPPPEGLGVTASYTSLSRLKQKVDNLPLFSSLDRAMDTASDILQAESAADVAPLRETISLLLHSLAVNQLRSNPDPARIDKTLSAITKIEKLRAQSTNSQSQTPPKKLKLDVTVTSKPAPPSAPTTEIKIVPADPPADA